MNRFLTFLAAVLAAGLIAACGSQLPPDFKPAPISSTSNSWPPPAKADMPVAANLLADNWEFILDASGSMGDSSCGTGGNARMETAKTGAIKFSRSLPGAANLGLTVFSEAHRDGINEWLKLGTGPSNRAEFISLVSGIKAYGGTPLRSAIELGVSILTEQGQRQRGYGTYHLVIVTDGEANPGQDPTNYVKSVVAGTPIAVHAIGFCVDGKHSLDIKGYTQYASANNPETLDRGLKAMLAESETFSDSQFVKQ